MLKFRANKHLGGECFLLIIIHCFSFHATKEFSDAKIKPPYNKHFILIDFAVLIVIKAVFLS